MMENPKSEDEKIIKNIGNLFRLKKKKKLILRDIKKLFEYKKEKENYNKPVRVNNFRCNNYIEYKSNCDNSRIL